MARFGPYLKRSLRARGWTQRQFAAKVDISPNTVSDWMSGLRRPKPDTLTKVAPVLGVPLMDLLSAAGYPVREGELPPEPTWGEATSDDVIEVVDRMLVMLKTLRSQLVGPNGEAIAC